MRIEKKIKGGRAYAGQVCTGTFSKKRCLAPFYRSKTPKGPAGTAGPEELEHWNAKAFHTRFRRGSAGRAQILKIIYSYDRGWR
jgi:hypothetical protein